MHIRIWWRYSFCRANQAMKRCALKRCHCHYALWWMNVFAWTVLVLCSCAQALMQACKSSMHAPRSGNLVTMTTRGGNPVTMTTCSMHAPRSAWKSCYYDNQYYPMCTYLTERDDMGVSIPQNFRGYIGMFFDQLISVYPSCRRDHNVG